MFRLCVSQILLLALLHSSTFASPVQVHYSIDRSGDSSRATIVVGLSFDNSGAACINGHPHHQGFSQTLVYLEVVGTDFGDYISFAENTFNCGGSVIRPIPDFQMEQVEVFGAGGDDLLFGYQGRLFNSNVQELRGEDGDDFIIGSGHNDYLNGGNGCDLIYGYEGDDTIHLGVNVTADGNCTGWSYQTARGGAGDDTITGTAGEDYLNGGAGFDVLWGEGGNDVLVGGGGVDALFAGYGDDCVYGYSGVNYGLHAGLDGAASDGNDYLVGHTGDDVLCDTTTGDADYFAGGTGSDYHHQSSGADSTDGSTSGNASACASQCASVVW